VVAATSAESVMRNAVVLLVFVFQTAQDRNGILDGGLGDEDRLKSPRQRRVLFDMLAVLVQRGCADANAVRREPAPVSTDWTPSIAPSALPAPIRVCISSMNRMMLPSADVARSRRADCGAKYRASSGAR